MVRDVLSYRGLGTGTFCFMFQGYFTGTDMNPQERIA